MGGQPDTRQEFWQGVGKAMMIVAYAAIGLIGKIAFDSMNGVLSKTQIRWKAVLCLTVGIIAGFFCEARGIPKWEKFIVPVTTIFGDSIMVYLMKNWDNLIERYVPWMSKKSNNGNNNKSS